ncbi:MAG: ComF family protein [Geminicoccaceae bacterium]
MLVHALLPARCLACGRVVDEQGSLCEVCWKGLRFIGGDLCRICGRPREDGRPGDLACAECADEPPAYDIARAALVYGTVGRSLILSFKHGGRIAGASTFARWMVDAGRPMLTDGSLLLPVPAHRWRLFARGFNQAALLAGHVARQTGLVCLPDTLRRVRRTVSQQGLGSRERRANVTPEAFAVAGRDAHAIADRPVVLIDDVLTTGSTVNACSVILRRAGACRIGVLTLARVAPDETQPI